MVTYGHEKKANPQYIKTSPRSQGEKEGGTKKEKAWGRLQAGTDGRIIIPCPPQTRSKKIVLFSICPLFSSGGLIMEKKHCTICKEQKDLENFCKDKSRRDGYNAKCKSCAKNLDKVYRKNNPDKAIEWYKKHYYNNQEKLKAKTVKWRKNNLIKARQYSKTSYNRKKDCIDFKINVSMSTGIYKSIKENKDYSHWEDLVGYTVENLMKHLESKFKPGMTWENYGSYWHIDHIKPKSWFQYNSSKDPAFRDCWMLENLQPLEAFLNLSKCNRFEG